MHITTLKENMMENNYVNKATLDIAEEYMPISPWGYFGYQLLFMIPFIGLVFVVIFSLGGTRNINLRNYARSQLCIFAILFVMLGVACLVLGFGAVISIIPRLNFR